MTKNTYSIGLSDSPITAIFLERAFCTKFGYDRGSKRLAGCIYDRHGRRVEHGIRIGGHGGDVVINSEPEYSEPPSQGRHFSGTTVYLGNLMSQYGHFITEGLSTFWPLQELRADNFVFHPFIFGDEIKPFMIPVHLALGVPADRVHVIREPATFERLIVPERVVVLNKSIHTEHRRTIRRVVDSFMGVTKVVPRKSVFVSRSRLPNNPRGVANEPEIDTLAEFLGFQVVYPEELSIVQQIALYQETALLAGCSGSALHGVLFQQAEAHIVEIGSARLPLAAHPMQVLCNLTAQVNAMHIPYVPLSDGNHNLDAVRGGLEKAQMQANKVLAP